MQRVIFIYLFLRKPLIKFSLLDKASMKKSLTRFVEKAKISKPDGFGLFAFIRSAVSIDQSSSEQILSFEDRRSEALRFNMHTVAWIKRCLPNVRKTENLSGQPFSTDG